MEKDKQRNQKTRRRERAQRMQAEKRQTQQQQQQQQNSKSKDCDSAEDELPLKEKPKRPPPPNRRKKATGGQSGRGANGIAAANGNIKESLYEEDIIDGFAIFSFTSYDDLEVSGWVLFGRGGSCWVDQAMTIVDAMASVIYWVPDNYKFVWSISSSTWAKNVGQNKFFATIYS